MQSHVLEGPFNTLQAKKNFFRDVECFLLPLLSLSIFSISGLIIFNLSLFKLLLLIYALVGMDYLFVIKNVYNFISFSISIWLLISIIFNIEVIWLFKSLIQKNLCITDLRKLFVGSRNIQFFISLGVTFLIFTFVNLIPFTQENLSFISSFSLFTVFVSFGIPFYSCIADLNRNIEKIQEEYLSVEIENLIFNLQNHTIILGNLLYSIHEEIIERKIEHEKGMNNDVYKQIYFVNEEKKVDTICVRKDFLLITKDPPTPMFKIKHSLFGYIGLVSVQIPFNKGKMGTFEIIPFIELSEEAITYTFELSFLFHSAKYLIYLFSNIQEFIKLYEAIYTKKEGLRYGANKCK